ncbi:MAG TPA: TetR/AcrR family transcriptional regulator [Anaerolineales bacterium]|nr:TetR/AcrR family transcriptional regulator [Anaerolineales bacterium]
MPEKKYHHGDLKNALIEAGAEILSKEGVNGFSLRKAARRAGVSHAAPYAHFADKQAFIAAVSTEGYRRLYDKLVAVINKYPGDPLRQFVEVAWAYVEFARSDPAHFKVTFSSVIEKEREFPEFLEMTGKNFRLLTGLVEAGQAAGILKPGAADAMAVSVWSLVHGFAVLLIEGQFSHTLLDRMTVRKLFIFTLNQITLVELTPEAFPLV